MNIFRFFHKNKRKGFTLMETLVTVGIVAVLCAIAIPSIITVNRSMNERDLDNSARAVYLAAQSNLAQMRSSGDLEKLAAMTSDQGARNVPESGNANMGDDWNEQLRHTVSGTSEAFNLVLPANVLDAQLREQQILIEYNPFSGHVYAVFYSEGDTELSYSLIGDRGDEAGLKENGIGYYCGGSVTIAPAEVNSTAVTLSADTDGQELVLTVRVPVPESYTNHQDVFRENLSAKITIHGEMSGTEMVIPTDSLSLEKNLCIGSPNYIEFTFVLDSLNTGKSFAKLNDALQAEGKSARFTLGENLTLTADVQFKAPEDATILTFDKVVITGVNSLFSRMEETTDDSGSVVSYAIELSNGRHLQNLNALDSSIAAKVKTIALVDDIYWNETVEYYTDAYVTPIVARAAEPMDYEHFVPIKTMVTDGETTTKIFGADASFDGNGHGVYYLNIATDADAGLFSQCALKTVSNLALVSPVVSGTQNVGALAGATNGATFTNCSVYIDTEDEYFSWDKMDEYGVVGSGTAGGLVGYVSGTNAAFTECFAAVPVTLENKTDQVDYAGGFVGKATNVKFTRCYASGDVEGEKVGGFVGLNDGSTFAQCFASGDVYAALTAGVAGGFVGEMTTVVLSYTECYAVGVVDGKEEGENKATVDGFCGAGLTLPTAAENDTDYFATVVKVYQNSYFLAHMPGETSLCAAMANYGQLSSVNNDSANVLTSDYWNPATEDTTHRYSVNGEGVYPFVMLKGMDFYGDWEAEQAPFAIAYFETYDDKNDDDKDDTGYYISDEKTSTLRNEDVVNKTAVIETDGYILLTNTLDCTVMVNGIEIEHRQTGAKEPVMFEDASYIYDLPDNKIVDSFYNTVTVKQTTKTEDDQSVTTTYTLYYNPDFALTQLNPVFNEKGEIEEEAQINGIPSKIYIRTARHLAAIAENTIYQGSFYNYVQMIDVDFGTYNWGTDGYTMKSIATFAGTYTGTGGYVDQAKIVLKDGVCLFGTVSGKVVDIYLSYEGECPANNWLAGTVSGTLDNCDVKWDGNSTAAAVAVAEETTGGEAAEAAETEAIPLTGGMVGTVEETGKVTECDLIAASVSGVDAGFVGLNEGEISCCTVAPKGTDGKTEGFAIGFAAENRGIIRGSMANTGATKAAFVGTNTGTIADCYAWYPGTTVTETEKETTGSTTETTGSETEIVFAVNNEGEILTSYAAMYAKSENGYSYALLYNESGIAAFVNTLEGAVFSNNWRTGSSYPYAVPKGINHRGGYGLFAAYPAFTGYYYYEVYDENTLGVYIETLDIAATSTTEAVDGKIYYELGDRTPARTGYGIFNMKPVVEASVFEVANVALTLDSAPMVPSELDADDYENLLETSFAEIFSSGGLTYTYEFKELSSRSVYVLNGTEINTWFAPMTEDGEYRIRTGEQFAGIEYFGGESFVQELDITVSAPVSAMDGTYDGDENDIEYTGAGSAMFGEVTGTVKNVVLKGANLVVSLSAENGEEVQEKDKTILRDSVTVGVLTDVAGEDAVIKNCRVVNPKITVTEKAVDGKNVEITAAIGGLVGENHGTVKVCSVEGLTLEHTAADLTNAVENTEYTANIALGGLVGYMTGGWMSESFATGEIKMTADAGDTVGGAIGREDRDAETTATYVDCYAAVTITADNACVGSFIGFAENGEFWACHGWDGVKGFVGEADAKAVSLSYCYYYNKEDTTVYQQKVSKTAEDATATIETLEVADCGSVSALVNLLNGTSDPAVWSDNTWDPEAEGAVIYNTSYPVLKDRYDANAHKNQSMTFVVVEESEEQAETVETETPADTAEPEATEQPDVTTEPEPTEQPDVTAEPEVTPGQSAEPEATETPAETAEPEITPEPTAEPTPVAEVTPEPTAETEPVSEEV